MRSCFFQLCGVLMQAAIAHTGAAASDCANGSRISAVVIDVTEDGVLVLSDGTRARLSGVLPLTVKAGGDGTLEQVIAAQAKGFPAELRFSAKRVPAADRHDRLAAQVIVKKGGNDLWLQRELVEQGLARVQAMDGDAACIKSLLAAEARARYRQRGYWRSGRFALHKSRDVATLESLFDTFQIVEGRVLSVGQVRRETFLNFGPVWKEDFTVIVPATIATRLREGGTDLASLERTRIRVRGYLHRRGGPAILLDVAGHLEVLRQE